MSSHDCPKSIYESDRTQIAFATEQEQKSVKQLWFDVAVSSSQRLALIENITFNWNCDCCVGIEKGRRVVGRFQEVGAHPFAARNYNAILISFDNSIIVYSEHASNIPCW